MRTLTPTIQTWLRAMYWPASLFGCLAIARIGKFDLNLPMEVPYLYQDAALCLITAPVFQKLRHSERFRLLGPCLFLAGLLWLSLAGMVVTQVLRIPANLKLLLQTSDLMFVRATILAGSVEASVAKTLAFAVLAPVVVAGGAFVALHGPTPPETRHQWRTAIVVCAAAIALLFTGGAYPFLRNRESNATFSMLASLLYLLRPATRLESAAPEAFRPIAELGSGESDAAPLVTGIAPRPGYDVFVYILETGVSSVMDLGGDDPQWLPHMRASAESSIFLERHLSTYASSTPSIFSLTTGLYPFPDYRNFVLLYPNTYVPNWVSALREQGYRTAAFTSIDGDFDRMDQFLLTQGFESVEDRESLSLPTAGDPTFGDDGALLSRFFDWMDRDPGKPYLFYFLPSNSHVPFFAPDAARIVPHETTIDRYKNALNYQDQLWGRLVDGLRERGRLGRTILVLVPDHGSYVRDVAPAIAPDAAIVEHHVPALIDHPDLRSPPRAIAVQAPTSHVDVGATILDLLGARAPTFLPQGISLLQPREERAVFYVDDLYANTITATNGAWLVQWDRDREVSHTYSWSEGSQVSLSEDALTEDAQALIQDKLIAFHAYQSARLESAAARESSQK